METDLWIKFVRLSTWSGITTITRSPMGVIRDNPDLFAMMMTAIDEAIAVGRARGVKFPANLVEETLKMIHRFPAESKSSMFEDLERGRPLELPWLSGAVVRLGREVGVVAPTHQFINAVLTPLASGQK
jgi:2-dehydropantoate 2-reductase